MFMMCTKRVLSGGSKGWLNAEQSLFKNFVIDENRDFSALIQADGGIQRGEGRIIGI